MTLNVEKCDFSRRTIKFLGHLIDENSIRADPDKTSAISEMEVPKTIRVTVVYGYGELAGEIFTQPL